MAPNKHSKKASGIDEANIIPDKHTTGRLTRARQASATGPAPGAPPAGNGSSSQPTATKAKRPRGNSTREKSGKSGGAAAAPPQKRQRAAEAAHTTAQEDDAHSPLQQDGESVGLVASKDARKRTNHVTAQQAKAAAARMQEEERRALRQRLAELEGQLIMDEQDERANAILTLDDLHARGAPSPGTANNESDVEEDNDPEQMDIDVPKRAAKPQTGEARGELDTWVLQLLKDKGYDLDALKRAPAGNHASSDTQSMKQKPTPIAKGLRRDWHDRISSSKSTLTEPAVQQSDPIGGLQDEDAAATRPSGDPRRLSTQARERILGQASTHRRNRSRRNTEVIELSSDEDTSSTPRIGAPSTIARPRAVKAEPQEERIHGPASHSPSPTPFTASATVGSSASNQDAQAVLSREWKTVIVPAVYALMFESETPFGCNMDIQNTGHLNQLLADLFPDVHIAVAWKDKTFTMAVSRWNEKRTAVGRRAEELVSQFFLTNKEFQGDKQKITNYAKWASLPEGPALYSKPMPQGCMGPKDPTFVPPDGLFEADIFINTLRPFLKSYLNTPRMTLNHRPYGLLGLVAAALERAFKQFKKLDSKGQKKSGGLFSKELWGDTTTDYITNVGRLSDRRWDNIYRLCGLDTNGTGPATVHEDDTEVGHRRRNLYMPPSSP
ncbi:hypothetical protein EV122DRAFT_255109 [Schizophyllum commune]